MAKARELEMIRYNAEKEQAAAHAARLEEELSATRDQLDAVLTQLPESKAESVVASMPASVAASVVPSVPSSPAGAAPSLKGASPSLKVSPGRSGRGLGVEAGTLMSPGRIEAATQRRLRRQRRWSRRRRVWRWMRRRPRRRRRRRVR